MTSAQEALEKARKKIAEDQQILEALEKQAKTEAGVIEGGKKGDSIESLMAYSGWSKDKVRALLVANGVLKSRKRKLTPQETHEVVSALKSGLGVAETVEKLNVAEAVVRKLAKENGIVARRAPRGVSVPEVSETDLARIRQFNEAVKKEFGYDIGTLAAILKKAPKQEPTKTSVGEDEAPVTPEAVGLDSSDTDDPANEVGGEGEAIREHHGDGDEPLPVEEAAPATTAGPPLFSPAETGMNEDADLPW